MSLPRGQEITELVGEHVRRLQARLPVPQRRLLDGPLTDEQRLLQLQLVLDGARLAARDIFLSRGARGLVVAAEEGVHFWLVPFVEVNLALPGLPADAHEVLGMMHQAYNPRDEAVVALLLSERRVRLLYMARDGLRGEIYQRAAPPPRPQATPGRSGLIGDATVTPTGYLIRVAHPERGLLGQIILTQLDPEHMLVETSVSGHVDDPTTVERRELLLPAMTALQQSFAAVRGDRAAARSIIGSVLTRGAVPADVPRRVAWQALPCNRCGRPALFLAFAEDADLTLDDYGRILFELMRDHGVPAWVVRG